MKYSLLPFLLLWLINVLLVLKYGVGDKNVDYCMSLKLFYF